MKRLLVLFLVIGLFGCAGWNVVSDDGLTFEQRAGLKLLRLSAMEYGTRAQGWFEWGNREQIAYTLIQKGEVNRSLIDAIKERISDYKFENPVVAQGIIEMIDEIGFRFDPSGMLITMKDNYSLMMLQWAAQGFRAGVTGELIFD